MSVPDLNILGIRTASRETLAQQVALLQQERLDLSRSVARLEQANAELTAELDGVREELARQASANEDLEATLALRTRELAAAEDRIQELRIQLDQATGGNRG